MLLSRAQLPGAGQALGADTLLGRPVVGGACSRPASLAAAASGRIAWENPAPRAGEPEGSPETGAHAQGMEYLHSKKIVHFDLKSANLLLGHRDRRTICKVADFGLSKQKMDTYVSGVSSQRGTLPWIAPEIIKTPHTVTEMVRPALGWGCHGGRCLRGPARRQHLLPPRDEAAAVPPAAASSVSPALPGGARAGLVQAERGLLPHGQADQTPFECLNAAEPSVPHPCARTAGGRVLLWHRAVGAVDGAGALRGAQLPRAAAPDHDGHQRAAAAARHSRLGTDRRGRPAGACRRLLRPGAGEVWLYFVCWLVLLTGRADPGSTWCRRSPEQQDASASPVYLLRQAVWLARQGRSAGGPTSRARALQACWEEKPQRRPNFTSIVSSLKRMAGDLRPQRRASVPGGEGEPARAADTHAQPHAQGPSPGGAFAQPQAQR